MLSHLLELRRRILLIIVVFLSLFFLFFFLNSQLFHQVVAPILKVLPSTSPLVATNLTSPLFTPIKLAIDAAILCTAPFALLQIWYFVAPGLYQRERKCLRLAIFGSLFLFFSGALFCYFVVLPFMVQFFVSAIPSGVHLMPDIVYVVDFITRMLLLFGISFQVPLLCFLLVQLNLTSIETLRNIRPYVIVSAFIIGMLLTPPDVLSQIMLAVPLCLLYELGIVLAIFGANNRYEYT